MSEPILVTHRGSKYGVNPDHIVYITPGGNGTNVNLITRETMQVDEPFEVVERRWRDAVAGIVVSSEVVQVDLPVLTEDTTPSNDSVPADTDKPADVPADTDKPADVPVDPGKPRASGRQPQQPPETK